MWLEIISIIILLIFVGIIIYLIVRLSRVQSELIEPSKCTAKSQFSVISNSTGNPLSSCVTLNNPSSYCVFNNVNSVNAAITICNNNAGICKAFSYDSNRQLMNIIDSTVPFTSSTTNDVYILQYT